MDPYTKFGFVYNPDDDTLARLKPLPLTTTEAHNSIPNQTIFTKDIPLNTTHKTGIRLYKPCINPNPHAKLPLILFFHGGGFVLGSAFDTMSDDLCTHMAIQLSAVILSLEHRLAPESRLPAAYEDAVEALLWIQNQALSGLRALCMDLPPLVIRGYILDHPAFTGLERSGSELRLANDPLLSLADCDMLWELSLPRGCNRDHEYSNPLVEGSYKDKIGMLGRCFVNTRGGDILVDYQLEFVKMLEANGVQVVLRFDQQGSHCMDIFEFKGEGKALFAAVKQFISS